MKLHRFAVVLGISVGLGGALLGFSGVADAAAPCATAAQIEALGETVRARVKASSGIELDWEIKRIGLPKDAAA